MTLRVGNLGILTKLIEHTYHGDYVLRYFFIFFARWLRGNKEHKALIIRITALTTLNEINASTSQSAPVFFHCSQRTLFGMILMQE